MSFVRTLVLLAVAAGLGAWLWLVEVPNAEKEARADFLVDFKPEDATGLALSYPGGSRIAVRKESGAWKMTAPVVADADGSVVENFLNTIAETKIERRLEKTETGDLSTYGLAGETGSQARLELEVASGEAPPAVVLGMATPVGHQAFARRADSEEVLVIPLLLQSSAQKTPFELRKKQLFEGFDSGPARKAVLRSTSATIELERVSEHEWKMTSPLVDAADLESVRSTLDSISTLDALAFYDGEAADRAAFGLGEDAAVVTVTREDGSTVSFALGKEATEAPAGNYLERRPDGLVAKVPDWAAKKFIPSPNELRQRRLVACRVDEVLSMTWSAGDDAFTISREAVGKPWKILPEVAGEVLNAAIVDNFVNSIVQARADEVVGDATTDADLAKWGLDKPVASFEATGTKGPCAALVAARSDAPPSSRDVVDYFLKDATRTAVMRANDHEFSRLAMRRSEFVDAAPKGAAEAGDGPDLGE